MELKKQCRERFQPEADAIERILEEYKKRMFRFWSELMEGVEAEKQHSGNISMESSTVIFFIWTTSFCV